MQSFAIMIVVFALVQMSISTPAMTKRDHARAEGILPPNILDKRAEQDMSAAQNTQTPKGLLDGILPSGLGGDEGMGNPQNTPTSEGLLGGNYPTGPQGEGRLLGGNYPTGPQGEGRLLGGNYPSGQGDEGFGTTQNPQPSKGLLSGILPTFSANVLGIADGADCGSSDINLNLGAISKCKRSRITLPPTA